MIDIVSGLAGAEGIEGAGIAGFVPDIPHGAIFSCRAAIERRFEGQADGRRAVRSAG